MTTFNDTKNNPRPTTEEPSSFKQERDENGTPFGALAAGEYVTVTPGSASNDSAFAITANTPPIRLHPHTPWGARLVRRAYNNRYGRTPRDRHGQDIDNPHIDTDGHIAEASENNATLYQIIEDTKMSQTLAQLILFGGYINIYDHDAFAS